ncbi:hypothetical protein [Luteipulveratus halotolerans]|uniref:DUF4145 domain-containing protein n=1 Tax=Luteipulveratus halotolerans TaxID=1631356 RepID=A0A0L6CG92_9MICO|nr:hypothetical protein [Luteipulveratus halotolerans]KNX36841.1 hypothetical protein VV01_06255 [Luteipulveratus halotolerans]
MQQPTWTDLINLIRAVLSWPVVVLVVLLVFRDKVRGLIDRMTKVDSPIASAEFVRELEGAERSSASAVGNREPFSPAGPATSPTAPPTDRPAGDGATAPEADAEPVPPSTPHRPLPPPMQYWPVPPEQEGRLPHEWDVLGRSNPSGLVIRSWEQLDHHINAVARAHDESIRTRSRLEDSLETLRRHGLVNDAYVEAAIALRNGRNMVAHDAQVPRSGAAMAYATTALDLRRKLIG